MLHFESSPVEGAMTEVVKTGIVGAILVIVMTFAFYAVMKWNQANESRVKDQKEMTKMVTDLTTELKDTLKDLSTTVEKIDTSVQENTTASDRLERSIDNVVRDAVRWGYRRPTPPGGLPRSGG